MTASTASKFVIGNCIRSHLVISTRNVPKDAEFHGYCILKKSASGEVTVMTSTPVISAVSVMDKDSFEVEGLDVGSCLFASASSLSRAIDSFDSNAKLKLSVSEGDNPTLVVTSATCSDDSQTVPLTQLKSTPPNVDMPKLGTSFSCSVDALSSAIGRIKYSLPVSEVVRHYTFIKTKFLDGKISIVAGNGQCFARTTFIAKDIRCSDPSKPVFMPSKELLNVVDYLVNNFESDDQVVVAFGKSSIGFSIGNFKAVISSAESVQWPEEGEILKRESVTKLSSAMAGWNSVHNGIRAVFELENRPNQLCKTKLTVDAKSAKAVLATGDRNVSKRTVSIDGESKVSQEAVSACFSSMILCEVIKASKACTRMTFEIDNSKYKGNPPPIIIKTFDDASSDPIVESFFSQLQ